ncbi:MAG: sensor histidine kinase [Bdellovibrionales bacterium]|nr:sensor histidine kinase [Bdellovibrionales bacterium]
MFTLGKADYLSRELGSETVWFQVAIKNTLTTQIKRYIVFSSPLTGWLDRYYLDDENKTILLDHAGSYQPRSMWPDQRGAGIFLVNLKAGESITYLFRHSSYNRLETKIFLQHNELVEKNFEQTNQYSAIAWGVLFALLTLNLTLFFYGRETIYLLYFFAASTLAVITHGLQGSIPIFTLLGGSSLIPYHLSVFAFYAIFASLLFGSRFITVRSYGIWIWPYRVVSWLSLIFALLGSIPLFYHSYGHFLEITSNIFILFSFLLVISSALHAIYQHNIEARFYLFSWMFLLLGIGFYYAANWGFTSYSVHYNSAILFGAIVHLLVASLGLSYHYYCFDNSKTEYKAVTSERGKLKRLFKTLSQELVNKLHVIQTISKQHARDGYHGSDWQEVLFACNNIQAIINNVRLEANVAYQKDNLSFAVVKVVDMLQEVHGHFLNKLNQKKIFWSVDVDPVDIDVLVDRNIIVMNVLSNVISNAIKFTKGDGQGSIYITVRTLGRRNADQVEITIRDNGIGIPVEIKKKIFDGGSEISRRGTDDEPGSGFGMGMIRDYIKLNNGSITIHSSCIENHDLTSGTAVTISLPKGSVG